MQQKDIVTVELPIGSDLGLPLDMLVWIKRAYYRNIYRFYIFTQLLRIISDRFPQIPPQIKFKKNIIHDSVEPETLLLRLDLIFKN